MLYGWCMIVRIIGVCLACCWWVFDVLVCVCNWGGIIDVLLGFCWCIIVVRLVHARGMIGLLLVYVSVCLVYGWCIVGVCLVYIWCFFVCVLLVYVWGMIGVCLRYYWRMVGASLCVLLV